MSKLKNEKKIINRGTGAGGHMTNHNGLNYEEITSLKTEYKLLENERGNNFCKIKFSINDKIFIKLCKANLFKYMKKKNELSNIIPASGCKNPDEVYLDEENKKLFIIEKKFQQTSGSVDEKIQTGVFKKFHYSQLFQNYDIRYIYCLSDWFKKKEYSSVLEYLANNDVIVFFGSSNDYKERLISLIST